MIDELEQKRHDKNKPELADIINQFTSNNCDKNRPYIEQQAKRSGLVFEGLTRRDICDCMVLGILTCKEGDDLPRIYVSESGKHFNDWDSFIASGEDFIDSYLDPSRVTYNDLFGWNLDGIDPVAAVQNMACFLERRLGIYPALQDED